MKKEEIIEKITEEKCSCCGGNHHPGYGCSTSDVVSKNQPQEKCEHEWTLLSNPPKCSKCGQSAEEKEPIDWDVIEKELGEYYPLFSPERIKETTDWFRNKLQTKGWEDRFYERFQEEYPHLSDEQSEEIKQFIQLELDKQKEKTNKELKEWVKNNWLQNKDEYGDYMDKYILLEDIIQYLDSLK